MRTDLLRAYKDNDVEYLTGFYKEKIPSLISAIKSFCKSEERCWKKENKPFGVEVQTIRLAGLVARLEYVGKAVRDYVLSKTDKIEELDEINLYTPCATCVWII